jgi:ribonucleoside-diphosphate reductase beta chain
METVNAIFEEAVEIEQSFIAEALPEGFDGMNSKLAGQYVQYVADFWLQELGFAPIFKATNPFPFMARLSMRGTTNFFEHRVTEYNACVKATTTADVCDAAVGDLDF